jgi:hypothetical protein
MTRMQLVGLGVLGGALTIIGAIGTWATIGPLSFSGTDANRGKTVAIAAGVGLLLLALAGWKNLRWAAMLAAVAGLISFGLAIWTLAAIGGFVGSPAGVPVGRGWGIWIATIGSLVLVIASFMAALVEDPDAVVETPSETTPT